LDLEQLPIHGCARLVMDIIIESHLEDGRGVDIRDESEFCSYSQYLSYIMQMMRTTTCVYNRSSHGKKAKIWIFEGHSPLNGQEIVLCRFRHSTLSMSEDLGFCSID